jgi:hypothetical protein
VAEKRTLPTSYGPEYETDVLLLGGNDGSLTAINGAIPQRIGLRRNRLPCLGEPDAIEVRLSGEIALIRYASQLELVAGGQRVPLGHYWHTDSYERRDGRWQAVWSQATEIQ